MATINHNNNPNEITDNIKRYILLSRLPYDIQELIFNLLIENPQPYKYLGPYWQKVFRSHELYSHRLYGSAYDQSYDIIKKLPIGNDFSLPRDICLTQHKTIKDDEIYAKLDSNNQKRFWQLDTSTSNLITHISTPNITIAELEQSLPDYNTVPWLPANDAEVTQFINNLNKHTSIKRNNSNSSSNSNVINITASDLATAINNDALNNAQVEDDDEPYIDLSHLFPTSNPNDDIRNPSPPPNIPIIGNSPLEYTIDDSMITKKQYEFEDLLDANNSKNIYADYCKIYTGPTRPNKIHKHAALYRKTNIHDTNTSCQDLDNIVNALATTNDPNNLYKHIYDQANNYRHALGCMHVKNKDKINQHIYNQNIYANHLGGPSFIDYHDKLRKLVKSTPLEQLYIPKLTKLFKDEHTSDSRNINLARFDYQFDRDAHNNVFHANNDERPLPNDTNASEANASADNASADNASADNASEDNASEDNDNEYISINGIEYLLNNSYKGWKVLVNSNLWQPI